MSSQGKRLDLASRNGNVLDLHATTSSFAFSQFDQSNCWCCKIKNWFCLLSESLRIIFDREGETFKLTILQYVFLWYDSLHWNNWRTEIDYGSIIWSGALVSNNTIWESFCVTRFEHLYSSRFILRDHRYQKVKLAQNKIFELCRKIRPYFHCRG